MSEPKDTDVVEKQTDEPVVEEETPITDEDTSSNELDFDELLSSGKKNKDTRKGLTRKAFTEKKQEAQEALATEANAEEMETLKEKVADLTQRLDESGEDMAYAKTFRKDSEADRASQLIVDTLAKKGVSSSEFNEHHKDAFLDEKQKWLDKGLSLPDATEVALGKVIAPLETKIAVEEAEVRAQGRKDISLPASSTTSASGEPYPLLAKEAYSNLLVSHGSEYWEKYNKYWEQHGKKDKPYS